MKNLTQNEYIGGVQQEVLTGPCGSHSEVLQSYKQCKKRTNKWLTCQFWEIQPITEDTKEYKTLPCDITWTNNKLHTVF